MLRAFVTMAALAAAAWCADISAGTYTGKWTGNSGADGDFRLTLGPDGKSGLRAEVMFTLAGQDVPCRVTRLKVEGERLEASYEFNLQDVKLESTIQGALKASGFEGTYKTKSVADGSAVDEGTWKASVVSKS